MPTDPTQERNYEGVSPDTCFEIFAYERRRYVLRCLEMYETPIALADLADEVARLEHDADTLAEVPREEVKRIYMTLYHAHIPKLEDVGFVAYDQESDMVRLVRRFSESSLSEML